jgi:hypothetical protein
MGSPQVIGRVHVAHLFSGFYSREVIAGSYRKDKREPIPHFLCS